MRMQLNYGLLYFHVREEAEELDSFKSKRRK